MNIRVLSCIVGLVIACSAHAQPVSTLKRITDSKSIVLGYRTDDFPAFYARTSGRKTDRRCDTAQDVARVIAAQRRLDLGGLLVANPIPPEYALDAGEIEREIAAAVAAAASAGIAGAAMTPFLLGRLNEATGGTSLAANIALVRNNVAVAGEIALAYAAL
jgi:pseudouridine-5'-phosphate glycosidase